MSGKQRNRRYWRKVAEAWNQRRRRAILLAVRFFSARAPMRAVSVDYVAAAVCWILPRHSFGPGMTTRAAVTRLIRGLVNAGRLVQRGGYLRIKKGVQHRAPAASLCRIDSRAEMLNAA